MCCSTNWSVLGTNLRKEELGSLTMNSRMPRNFSTTLTPFLSSSMALAIKSLLKSDMNVWMADSTAAAPI